MDLDEIDARLVKLVEARRHASPATRRLWDEKINRELDQRLREHAGADRART